jgi:hypothetical protein
MVDTYHQPEHGWTCFHCGETFTTIGGARDHFGATPDKEPGCMIRVQLGGERGLLKALRKSEDLLARHMSEDTDLHRHLYTLQGRHSEALRDAEETGYARGLKDYQALSQQLSDTQAKLEAAERWLKTKARHHISCMKLDCYDERDHGCTCGLEALTQEGEGR